jgi:hypothetical protein
VCDENGEFNDPDLEENAPLVYAYVKILLEVYDLTDIAFQRMKGQPFHFDPRARLADSDEKHCILTLDGDHALAFRRFNRRMIGTKCGVADVARQRLNPRTFVTSFSCAETAILRLW